MKEKRWHAELLRRVMAAPQKSGGLGSGCARKSNNSSSSSSCCSSSVDKKYARCIMGINRQGDDEIHIVLVDDGSSSSNPGQAAMDFARHATEENKRQGRSEVVFVTASKGIYSIMDEVMAAPPASLYVMVLPCRFLCKGKEHRMQQFVSYVKHLREAWAFSLGPFRCKQLGRQGGRTPKVVVFASKCPGAEFLCAHGCRMDRWRVLSIGSSTCAMSSMPDTTPMK